MVHIRVGGVYGVGKTATIDLALEALSKQRGIDIVKIKGSEIMARILQIHPDLLPEQTEEARCYARTKMYEEMSRIPNGIRDAHFSVITENGGFEFPRSNIDQEHVEALIVITAHPEIISERRRRCGRVHRSLKIEDITLHQSTEIQAAASLARQLSVPLYIVDNSHDGIESAANKIGHIILKYVHEK